MKPASIPPPRRVLRLTPQEVREANAMPMSEHLTALREWRKRMEEIFTRREKRP